MKNRRVLLITQTAVMLALLVGGQFVTFGILGQFVTGSYVNLILLTSVFMLGLASGIIVALASPVLAFLVGIGPAFIQIVPFIAAANVILVTIAWLVRKRLTKGGAKNKALAAAGIIAAGAAKTAFFWAGLVVIALPLIPGINEKQAAVIGASFTWPQMVTAVIGGIVAMTIVPLLKKALPSIGCSSNN